MDKIEHIGIAVKNLEESNTLFAALFGKPHYKIEEVASEGVKTSFFKSGPNKIELLEATKPDSPIAKFLEKQGAIMLFDKMTREKFHEFALSLENHSAERESDGTVIIMPLVHGGSGKREAKIITFLGMWQLQTEKGEVFGSTTGFDLPDGSTRAPDAAWISEEKMSKFSEEELEESFVQVVPDFVVELHSRTDRLKHQKDKMKEVWMANGTRLGWLIDPYEEKVHIFRKDGKNEVLSGENVMSGLEVPLNKLRLKKKKK